MDDIKFDELTKQQLLKIYRAYNNLKNNEDIKKLQRQTRVKKYQQTDKGRASLSRCQKSYYYRNRDKILEKRRLRREQKKKEKEEDEKKSNSLETTENLEVEKEE